MCIRVICRDFSKWTEYEDQIYAIFEEDLIVNPPYFDGLPVQIRKYPLEFGRENAFWHVTCCDFYKESNREPDIKRCERIRWIKAFVENYDCNRDACIACDGVFAWGAPYKKKTRIKILLEEERYVVILEKRETYVLLITAYYLDQDHQLRKLLKEFQKAGSAPVGTQPGTLSTHGR